MSFPKYHRAVHLFRRDLRVEDNTALLEACKYSGEVVPVFCFDPRQIEPGKNTYFSEHSFRFLCDSLIELDEDLKKHASKLHVLKGDPSEELGKILEENEIEAVFVNADYTPFSRKRDEVIQAMCEKLGVAFVSCHDLYLSAPGSVLTDTGEPYKVFTPFARKARRQEPKKPQKFDYEKLIRIRGDGVFDIQKVKEVHSGKNNSIVQKGGRENARAILQNIQKFADYDTARDTPVKHGTTRLSAHLKFGTISVREMYWKVRLTFDQNNSLINELYWRDFYGHVVFHFPHVLGNNFQEKYQGKLWWENDEEKFTAWCEGRTGFPIVDAGMRELGGTGWMHNRVRMIVASFLTKDLHIDWLWGERYFANKLVDYDVASNNGGWQWASSTGTDAQPYFRIFNPWRQGATHDPECEYVKKFVPELGELSAKDIHAMEKTGVPEGIDYPTPIVDHSIERKRAIEIYKDVGE